jgi:hypothetical protein
LAEVQFWQQQQHVQHGGGSGNNPALAAAAWRMLTIIAMVTMTMMIDY